VVADGHHPGNTAGRGLDRLEPVVEDTWVVRVGEQPGTARFGVGHVAGVQMERRVLSGDEPRRGLGVVGHALVTERREAEGRRNAGGTRLEREGEHGLSRVMRRVEPGMADGVVVRRSRVQLRGRSMQVELLDARGFVRGLAVDRRNDAGRRHERSQFGRHDKIQLGRVGTDAYEGPRDRDWHLPCDVDLRRRIRAEGDVPPERLDRRARGSVDMPEDDRRGFTSTPGRGFRGGDPGAERRAGKQGSRTGKAAFEDSAAGSLGLQPFVLLRHGHLAEVLGCRVSGHGWHRRDPRCQLS
jgi:hypothetical protein